MNDHPDLRIVKPPRPSEHIELIPGVHLRDDARWIPTLEDGAGAIIWTGLPCSSKSDAQVEALTELGQRRRDGLA